MFIIKKMCLVLFSLNPEYTEACTKEKLKAVCLPARAYDGRSEPFLEGATRVNLQKVSQQTIAVWRMHC